MKKTGRVMAKETKTTSIVLFKNLTMSIRDSILEAFRMGPWLGNGNNGKSENRPRTDYDVDAACDPETNDNPYYGDNRVYGPRASHGTSPKTRRIDT